MYTGGCAVNSTGVLTLRSGVSSFTQRRVCCTGEAAETGDCGSTGCLSSSASAFFARELSLSPAFLYSHYYYLRRRPAFLYSIPNPAAYITRLYGRSEVRCREKALLGLSARRASTRRLISCCCVVGACSEHEPMCVCRGLLEDAEQEELEEKEEEGCCPGHDTVSISGYSNSESWENEAENKGYGRKAESERVSRWGYGRTSTTDGSTIAVKNRKKQNKVRTSTSVTSNGFFGDSHSQKNSHSSRRDESTARVQDSVHNKLLGRSSHISSLSETKNTSFQQNNSSSKKVVDSRFSSKVGEEFSSDASYQIRQGRIHTDTRQENTERRSQKGSEVLNATCQADHNLNVADIQANKTDEAALVERLIEEVRRQSIEIEKLRESYKALESRSELRQSRTEAVTRVETNEYSSASISNLVEELRRQLIEINSLSRSYQELNASIAYKNDTERLSHSSRQSISNINDREERFTSVVNLEREENEQLIRQKQSRVDQKKVVNSSEIYETDVLKKSSSYEVYKTNFREEEESSTSAIYVTKDSRKQHEQKALANESFGELIGPSRVSSIENQQSCSLDGALMSQHDDQEQRVASALHSIEEWRENLAHQAESEKDHEKRSEPVKLPEAGSKYGTRPIPLTSSGPKGKEVVSEFDKYANEESKYHKEISTSQQIIDIDLSLDSFKSSEILGTEETLLKDDVLDKTQGVKPEGKSSQFSMQNLENDNTETSELLEKRSGSTSSINDSYENLVLGSGGSQMHAQQTHQIGPIKNNDSCDDRQDVLESARLLNASSSSYVAEFVSELKKETSGTQELDISLGHSSPRVGELDNTEEINRKSEKIKSGMQQNTPALLEKSKSERYTEEALNQLERLPEAAGPSDEMWDLTSSSRQACQKDKENKEVSEDKVDETLAGINSGNTVAKRSGRSLWNLIADIIRISWASNAGKSHKSTTQSGTRSSSNESTGSEVWFSGHEHEEDSNEPSKQRKKPSEEESDITSKPQESACSQEPAKPQNKDAQKDTGLFAENSNKKNASVGSSIVTGNLGLNAEDLVGSSIPYVSGMLNSSTSKITLVSSVESEIEKLDRNPIHEIAAETLGHDSSNENPHGIKEPGETDGDLRRRKFQRNKQVLRDKFDEWEEAHNMETVQRKKDEFFMKEALLEAKKAAESWEVPIGAVLVQNGKIIARSGNMVEECRDSTAHAEIVCIREASKLLKTWRLSETILYVTLEPCAMCAGAILQARVDTVVWGAPNKLLGADGSWVRLFPSGIGEQPSLDNADQTAGPIHPFHPKIIVRRGVLGTECADIMQQFFQLRRKEKRQETPGPSRLSVSKHPTRFLAKMHDVFSMMFCL